MRRNVWLWYVVVAGVATVAYYAFGHSSVLFNLIGASSPFLILIAARSKPRGDRAPWYLFALGQGLFIAGDVVAYNYEAFFGTPLPYPAVSDALYLAVYPCLTTGLILLIRRRVFGADRAGLLDSLMIGVGVGTLSWAFLISPYALDASLAWPERVVSMSYPLADLMLLTVAIRLAVGGGRRPFSFYLIVSSIVALLLTDAIYGWLLLHSGYTPGSGWLEVGWIVFYLLFGAAALHPSSIALADHAVEPRSPRAARMRPVLLGAAALAAPFTALLLTLNDQLDAVPLMLLATIALFVLAMIRLFGVMREQAETGRRANTIREAGARLIGASDRDAILRAAVQAISDLAPQARICVWHRAEDAAGFLGTDTAGLRHHVDAADLPAWQRERLVAGHGFGTAPDMSALGVLLDPGTRYLHAQPVVLRSDIDAIFILGLPGPLPASVAADVEGFGSQVVLALERVLLAEELYHQRGEARLTSLVKNSSDVFVIVDPDATIRYISPSAERLLGHDPAALEGTSFLELVQLSERPQVATLLARSLEADTSPTMEVRIRNRARSTLFTEIMATSLLEDEAVGGIVLNVRDISERKAVEQLEHQAFHDPLTGLANRSLFRDRVRHALERRRRSQIDVAVLFLDLDDFKNVNDTLGHAGGDELLREVGARIQRSLRESDTAARLGGDEFAILLDDPTDAAPAATRLLDALEQPFIVRGLEVVCQGSIGIAFADHAVEVDVDGLLRDADAAMYLAKRNGKDRFEVFEPWHEGSDARPA